MKLRLLLRLQRKGTQLDREMLVLESTTSNTEILEQTGWTTLMKDSERQDVLPCVEVRI